MYLALSILPIALLIFWMTKPRPMSSHMALPLTAVLVYLLKLMIFGVDITLLHASVLKGLLDAFVPIMILLGAVLLSRTMENSGAMRIIEDWMAGVTTSKIGQVMIVAWSFSFLIEGVSGFGTPAAIAAPILVGMRIPPVQAGIICLVMNSVPVSMGAVGTPTWFGLGTTLKLSHNEILEVGFKSSLVHTAAAFLIPLLALRTTFSWKEIRRNLLFIELSIVGSTIPFLIISWFNYEYPALLGGLIGLVWTVFLARHKIGLDLASDNLKRGGSEIRRLSTLEIPSGGDSTREVLLRAFFPIWGTVLLLVITRLAFPESWSSVSFLDLNHWIKSENVILTLGLGRLGNLTMSDGLVFKLTDILGTTVMWTYRTLYVPSILPFFPVAVVTFLLFQMRKDLVLRTFAETGGRMLKPVVTLFGAVVFVTLLDMGDRHAADPRFMPGTLVIGQALAGVIGKGWMFAASYLGGIGAFFSGSNTVSNMTFGGIQRQIALELGLNVTSVLALQNVGGAMADMACISKIVAVCSVLGLAKTEGVMIRTAAVPALVYGVIAGLMSLVLVWVWG